MSNEFVNQGKNIQLILIWEWKHEMLKKIST